MTITEVIFIPTVIAVAFIAYNLGYRHGGNTCIKILNDVMEAYRRKNG